MIAFLFRPTIYCWIAICLSSWWYLSLNSPTNKFPLFLKTNAIYLPNTSRPLVIATLANEAYIPLVELFVSRLSALRIEHAVVFCIDPFIYEYCISHDIPAWPLTDLPTHLFSSFPLWQPIFQSKDNLRRAYPAGNIEFISLTQLKYLVFYSVVAYNFDLLFSDPDILWIQNPIPYLQNHDSRRPIDIYIQTDRKYSYQSLFSYMNTGFVYIRSHCATHLLLRIMMQQIYPLLQQHPSTNIVSQQRSFNQILCRTSTLEKPGVGGWYSKRVDTNTCHTFLEPDDTFLSCVGVHKRLEEELSFNILGAHIVTQVLDPSRFPHGAFTRKQGSSIARLVDIQRVDEYMRHPNRVIIHFNWIRGVANKTRKMSQALAYVHRQHKASL
ncbi:hypothetical protein GAYE_SCF08G3007 [Galdieria yellowstonensis]|uniref:Nucleotide-diphospho-sugar transferase domain-containing protein n=1 Tax=Galdieria yellowstonensis TaxID=3028027 RepID=A0AAV9ICG9_9RHOD|nr:hypothetical protein GAYE_SCF08G3007 [Galdieria yellowstonensis]